MLRRRWTLPTSSTEVVNPLLKRFAFYRPWNDIVYVNIAQRPFRYGACLVYDLGDLGGLELDRALGVLRLRASKLVPKLSSEEMREVCPNCAFVSARYANRGFSVDTAGRFLKDRF